MVVVNAVQGVLFVSPLDCASQVFSVEKLRRLVVQLIGGIRS